MSQWLRRSTAAVAVLAFALGLPIARGAEDDETAAEEAAEDAAKAAEDAAEATAEATRAAVFSFRDDLVDFPNRLWRDVKSLPTLENAVVLSGVGGLAAISREEWDDDVREETQEDPRRFGRTANHLLDNYGSTPAQMIGVSALYGASLFLRNERLHEFTVDVVHSIVIEIPITFGLKYAFDTRRPNGEARGFPSGHAASSFAIAAAFHQNYGPWAGLAAYTIAGLVSFHRIDTAEHDLSDVIFGSGLGYVVGSSAAGNEPPQAGTLRPTPFFDPLEGARGLGFEWRF